MAYGISPADDSCYSGTTVLINKLGIRNQAQLDESETLIFGVKSLQFELNPFQDELDFQYYKRLHKFLFDEVYDWAGQLRTINMSKQHTHFCPVHDISDLGVRIFSRLATMGYFRLLNRNELLREFADLYASINYLHPFREGNGRTQRLYFRQLANRAGYKLNFAAVDSDRMMLATIHAASGIGDSLIHIFDEILELQESH
jgi:cell filamentation protein